MPFQYALLFGLAAFGCAKHVTAIQPSSLIGSWSTEPDPSSRDFMRWTFRPDGTAEFRTHLAFALGNAPDTMADQIFTGPYRLVGNRLTITLSLAEHKIANPDYDHRGSPEGMTQGNRTTFENVRLENGKLVAKVQKTGKEITLYPWHA